MSDKNMSKISEKWRQNEYTQYAEKHFTPTIEIKYALNHLGDAYDNKMECIKIVFKLVF